MNALYELQRGLYGGVLDALKTLQTQGWESYPGLIAAAFSFGLLHALLPGHGKSVLAACYAGDGRMSGAVMSSIVLIVTHVGSAIVLVLGGFAVLQRTIVGAGRAPLLEQGSYVLIVAIGLWLLWRSLRRAPAGHRHSGPVLGLVTGIVPCPLTTFVMTYAAAKGIVAAGLILSATFATGMIVTVAAFPLLAVLLRAKLVGALARTAGWRYRIGRGLETGAALAVIAFGTILFLQR
jgi:nickel/cobalt transporter (NicO) family protein